MKLSVERQPESQVILDITADDDEFGRAMDRAFRKVGQQISIPGFRKGKAPRAIIEQMYGRGVFLEEAHKEVMEDLYRRALKEAEVIPVGDPHIDITAAEPLGFRVTVPVYPTVDPGPYQDVRVEPADAAVDDAAVDEVIERLRVSQSPWVDPPSEGMEVGPDLVLAPKIRTPREGDQVTIDLAVTENGQPFQEPVEDAVFVLGESNLFDRLREEIQQLRPDQSTRFSITFAEDDETVSPEVRAKTLEYAVTLKALKQRDLLPLDDEFARTVAEAETLDELRTEVRDDLHQGRTAEARTSVVNQIINAMAEQATIDPPPTMIDEAVDDDVQAFRQQLAQSRRTLEEYLRLNEQTEDDLRAELRPAAARRLRNSLLLREIAEREQIEIADADIDAEIARLAGPEDDEPNAERMRRLYQSDYFRRILRNDLFERRITDRLIAIATEDRGAVLNGWVEPEPDPDPEPASSTTAAAATSSEATESDETDSSPTDVETDTALDQAPTLGTMPGQPGDLAATAITTDSPEDTAVRIADVAAEPDAAQSAAVAHDQENATIAADAPPAAITPEEREAQGPPDDSGALPNPTY